MLVTGHGLNTNALVVTLTRLRAARLGYRTSSLGRGKRFSLVQRVKKYMLYVRMLIQRVLGKPLSVLKRPEREGNYIIQCID
jgi:hypothetical protein